MSHHPDAQRATHAHTALSDQGMIPPGLLASAIEASWRRSQKYGLDTCDDPDYSPLAPGRLADIRERNRVLVHHARPVMETLYEQIVDTQSMVVLTDADGLILNSLGDDDFLARAEKVALRPGVVWSEKTKGTNAIGTAITDRAPALVHGPEHFLRANHFLTCSAIPLLDPLGGVIGVLDVTGDWRGYHRHTMALVRMSGQLIENHLFTDTFPDHITLHFHTRAEFVGTLCEGMVAFSLDGRAVAANASALFQLGVGREILPSKNVTALFGTSIGGLVSHARMRGSDMLTLSMHTGVRASARVTVGASVDNGRSFMARIALQEPEQAVAAPAPKAIVLPAPSRPGPVRENLTIDSLKTGDDAMATTLARIQKVIGRDIAILIQGETGTGKELLARAIHNDSPRHNRPFVAVNCAAIPEGLIESELFGYEEGAFTGARKKGSVGRILQADGGTLFLDEIGDMPLNLQARLLRVLQERVVTPLGSTRSQPVDVAIICATHRKLKELISQGRFREDLYYRLNGLQVGLPPLCARQDLDAVVSRVLRTESGAAERVTVSSEVLELFRRHPWPGNIRQLSNLLRTAVAIAGDDPDITRGHLPEDFFDDLEPMPFAATPVTAAPASAQPAIDTAAAGSNLADIQLATIRRTLAETQGNVSATARRLGISRNTIYRKLNAASGPLVQP